jgi:hypothetical protein
MLPVKEIQALFEGGHGTAPDLIYERGVPDTIDPGQTNFDKTTCTLIVIEIGFSLDLGCDKKHMEKTEKYSPLVAALRLNWGRVEFVAIPIGYAGTMLTRTPEHLIAAFFTVRPRVDHTSVSKGTSQPTTDSNAKRRDYLLFKSLLDPLTDLAQSRLLDIYGK